MDVHLIHGRGEKKMLHLYICLFVKFSCRWMNESFHHKLSWCTIIIQVLHWMKYWVASTFIGWIYALPIHGNFGVNFDSEYNMIESVILVPPYLSFPYWEHISVYRSSSSFLSAKSYSVNDKTTYIICGFF